MGGGWTGGWCAGRWVCGLVGVWAAGVTGEGGRSGGRDGVRSATGRRTANTHSMRPAVHPSGRGQRQDTPAARGQHPIGEIHRPADCST